MSEWILKSEDLVVGYHSTPILPALTFEVEAGEVWGIIGANGSGKSTLLKTLLGLLPPISGDYSVAPGVNVGYVPQRYGLDTSVPARVIDVVRQGTDRNWSFLNPLYLSQKRESIQQAMLETNTTQFRDQQFSTLSEGQKQRVLIARALASEPKLLMLDEPTSAMDSQAERGMFELVARLKDSRDLGVLLVSHHLPVLGEFASHAIYVDRDEHIVVPGDIQSVCQCAECVSRYGHILNQDHTHDENCDHPGHAHG